VSDNPINMVHDQLPQHPTTQQATCCQHSLLPHKWHCSSCCTASNRVRKCTVQKNAARMLQPLSEKRYQVSLCVTHCPLGGKHQKCGSWRLSTNARARAHQSHGECTMLPLPHSQHSLCNCKPMVLLPTANKGAIQRTTNLLRQPPGSECSIHMGLLT
jgi:hypothetical protein